MSLSEGEEPEGVGPQSKADKVYTVGCFDLLHRGHRNLFARMRQLGKEVSGWLGGWVVMCMCAQIVTYICLNWYMYVLAENRGNTF